MVGYLGNDEANAKAFTDDAYVRLGDLGYMESGHTFVYLARLGDTLREVSDRTAFLNKGEVMALDFADEHPTDRTSRASRGYVLPCVATDHQQSPRHAHRPGSLRSRE